MKIKELKEIICKGIFKETGLLVVDTDNNYRRPKYPFYSLKFTSILKNSGEAGNIYESFPKSLDSRFKHDYQEELELQPKVVMSFNAYSKDTLEAMTIIQKAYDYFRFRGEPEINEANIVVVDVGDIQDRTIFLGDYYEYRYGFDVEFRMIHTIERRSETIESYKFKKGKDL